MIYFTAEKTHTPTSGWPALTPFDLGSPQPSSSSGLQVNRPLLQNQSGESLVSTNASSDNNQPSRTSTPPLTPPPPLPPIPRVGSLSLSISSRPLPPTPGTQSTIQLPRASETAFTPPPPALEDDDEELRYPPPQYVGSGHAPVRKSSMKWFGVPFPGKMPGS